MNPDSNRRKKLKEELILADRSDAWLLREWKMGNELAAEVIFHRYAIRLVTLVATRLNKRYRPAMDPDDVVQSAMVSFFNAARESRIEISRSVSLWRLLATFARRKMARKIERQLAQKRGGNHKRIPLDEADLLLIRDPLHPEEGQAEEVLRRLMSELPPELQQLVEGAVAGKTHRELAETLEIDERTVRRRLTRLREHLAEDCVDATANERIPFAEQNAASTRMPRVDYNEFVLGKLIGSGGFGKVYRASIQADGRTVAVKFLRKGFWQNDDARRSFEREIELASRINHAGLVRYIGYGESPHGGPYLLSEWIDGRTLHDEAHASLQQFHRWLVQICHAIDAVHLAGLVHGDITPRNILINKRDQVVVTDFGFSRATATSTNEIIGGTLGFAAPEQIDPCFGLIGPRTDIYSVGGLIHWFLFGTPPNAGVNIGETIRKTTQCSDSRATEFLECAEPYRSILEATLCLAPADRIESAHELIRLLEQT